jgi:glucosamine kinase
MSARTPTRQFGPAASRLRTDELVLGVDGGGTKTRAVIVDAGGHVLGDAIAGPSNPLRVGVGPAASAVRDAVERACSDARARRGDIAAAQVGLAGVRRHDLRDRMREALRGLGIRELEVVTDADIALHGATGGEPGLVIIAGTGSICCGANARGQRACAGGWGPLAGDEGSGSWIARRALQAVARATDGRGEKTSLVDSALGYFHVASADDIALAIYSPTMTNQIIAGFARHVIEAAGDGDDAARAILVEAGRELGAAAVAVVRSLRMERERFQAGYVGGVFTAGELMLKPLRAEMQRVATRATLVRPRLAPAEAAADMARAQLRRLALAG